MEQEQCEHDFVHGGVKYEIKDWLLAGSGARPVHYFDWFYCRRCLENKYKEMDVQTNTYEKIAFNATPKSVTH